ncbi:MAG: hypothetical protein HY717_05095 [Planctomycetes bacterium]|nr:hypothetical protein [Planctomycetota bacterium]
MPEDRYKFFGEVALEQRFVTEKQLYEALTIQAHDKALGKPERLLGQILLELNYMTDEQVAKVLNILFPVKEEVE